MGTPRVQSRNNEDGRYTFDGDLQRLCMCGHSLGVHAGEAPHDCLLYSFSAHSQERKEEAPENGCRCQKFKPQRKSKAKRINCKWCGMGHAPRSDGNHWIVRSVIPSHIDIKECAYHKAGVSSPIQQSATIE